MTVSPSQSFDAGTSFDQAVERVRAEFNEMPGLSLTLHQAARLWAFDLTFCAAVLTALEDSRFLVRLRHEVFARAE